MLKLVSVQTRSADTSSKELEDDQKQHKIQLDRIKGLTKQHLGPQQEKVPADSSHIEGLTARQIGRTFMHFCSAT